MRRTTISFFTLIATLFFSLSLFAQPLEDEPDELNWDTLGGSLASFNDFVAFTDANPDYRARLLAQAPSASFGRSPVLPNTIETIALTPSDFPCVDGWNVETLDETPYLTYPGGHGGGVTRVKATIPKSGYYRLWAAYRHEQGTHASFVLRIEDPRVLDLTGPMQTIVQDVVQWKFDFAEMGRRSDPLPTRKDLETGILWESAPICWLEKGERAIALSGTICEGPFAPRKIAAIVLTEEPLDMPELKSGSSKPSLKARDLAQIWARRPIAGRHNPQLVALWKEWRDAFYAKLASDEPLGLELDRMKALVAFDDASNLIGTPKQIATEKARFEKMLASVPKNSFTMKIEGEDYEIMDGWYVSDHSDASGGKILMASYGDAHARASYTIEIPRAGVYSIWSRVLELPGYLSKFSLLVQAEDVDAPIETIFCNDEEENKRSPGMRWIETKCELPAGKVKLTLQCEGGPGLTYRRYDETIITDRNAWTPEGQGEIVPIDRGTGLVCWTSDPWAGFTRLSVPRADQTIDGPIDVELPIAGIANVSLLVRNASDQPKIIRPEIINDDYSLLSWRVQALTLSPQFGWVPHALLNRETVSIPPRQTVGIWLTFDGDKTNATDDLAPSIRLADQTIDFRVKRTLDLRDAPIPLVGGWNAPYERVSCWNAFHKLGLNVLNDVIVPCDEAQKFGLKLFVKLNDDYLTPEHIAEVVKSFKDYGYDYDDWAWSFMDEPGASASDRWVELAKQFKELAPDVRVWCNPGELWGAPAESNLKMLPYVNCYCPYADHFWQNGGANEAYRKELQGEGRQYAIRLTYTTPCFAEKAPGAPADMFGPMNAAIQNNLDGWMFYALLGRYEYCNSLWDEMNAYMPDQAVNLYPGVGGKTIYTRSAMAIRAAVDAWRTAKIDAK